MVALHKIDLPSLGSEPAGPCIAVVGDVAFVRQGLEAISDFRVHYVADAAALDRLSADQTVQAIVAGTSANLAEAASRLRTRLIVVAPQLSESVVDAISRGADLRWAPDDATLVAELRQLRHTRSADAVRHVLADVRVQCAGVDRGILRDLSNDGLAFEIGDADVDVERLLPGCEVEGLVLRRKSRICLSGARALVRHLEPLSRGRYLVGCALKPSAAGPATTATVIRDRGLCAALVKAALRHGIVVTAIDADARDGASELELIGGRVDSARGILSAACERSLQLHDIVRGHFELAGRLYKFASVVVGTAPLELKLPTVLEETQQRASARHRPQPNEALTVEISSPLCDAPVVKTIFDLSSNGFSFTLDGARDLFPPGLVVDVTLRLPDGLLACAAEVRTLVRDGARLRCGVELVGSDVTARIRLANSVMQLRFPGVGDGGGLEPNELFDFFRVTGFLPPAKEAVLAPVMEEMRASYRSLYAQRSPVFKAVVSRDSDGALVGHVSGVRVYAHTWMSQHLAAKPSKHIAHLLNLGTAEYFGQNPDLEYFKIYFDKYNKWPARVFGGFARTLYANSQSELRSYRHVVLSTAQPMPSIDGIDVLEASPDELAIVERYFVQREQAVLLRADDLSRKALQLSDLNRQFGAVGLYRRRRVLVAMRRNVCLGFALAELSSPGLNLSEALSAFRIFVTDEGQSDQDDIRRALMAAVLPIYRNAQRAYVRGMFAPEEADAYRRIGAPVTDEVWMSWTCHRTLYPRFCDWVERLFAVLDRRARRP